MYYCGVNYVPVKKLDAVRGRALSPVNLTAIRGDVDMVVQCGDMGGVWRFQRSHRSYGDRGMMEICVFSGGDDFGLEIAIRSRPDGTFENWHGETVEVFESLTEREKIFPDFP